MSEISQILHAQALERAFGAVKHYEQQLANHVKQDFEAIKSDLEECVAHCKGEVKRLKGLVDSAVAAHLAEGAPAEIAVQLAAAGQPTRAQVQATGESTQKLIV